MKKLKEIKKFIVENISDVLTILAIIIIAINSIIINVAFGFYVLALELIIIANFLSRLKKRVKRGGE